MSTEVVSGLMYKLTNETLTSLKHVAFSIFKYTSKLFYSAMKANYQSKNTPNKKHHSFLSFC